MHLQTQLPIQRAELPIDYGSSVVLFGSCFSQHMGNKLAYFNFKTYQNPFGILFHPIAIEAVIQRALGNHGYCTGDVFHYNNKWHCFDAHSVRSENSQTVLLEKLNKSLTETHVKLQNATHVIITLGTAWVYWNKDTQSVVGNCHKLPQQQFKKILLPIVDIVDSLQRMVNQIHQLNDKAQFIFTISPVRHLKDGFMENQRSKSHLIAALNQFMDNGSNRSQISYFPSYELMMDELRDYRFYDKDMVHPNELAIDYIWEKFCDMWISPDVSPVMEKVDQVKKGLNHRPFDASSAQHQKFKQNLADKIRYLKEQFPYMEFKENS